MKKSIELWPFAGAMPVVIVAVKDEEKLNFAPHGMYGKMSFEPPLLHISVLKNHETAKIINKINKFSVNIATTDLLEKVKHCGSISGVDKDKSNEFEVFYGQSDVPMICKSPVNMSCEVYQTIETNDMYIYIGKVVEAFSDEEYIEDNYPVVTKIDPLICTEQGEYYRMGSKLE